jgi:hypothetical protein
MLLVLFSTELTLHALFLCGCLPKKDKTSFVLSYEGSACRTATFTPASIENREGSADI